MTDRRDHPRSFPDDTLAAGIAEAARQAAAVARTGGREGQPGEAPATDPMPIADASGPHGDRRPIETTGSPGPMEGMDGQPSHGSPDDPPRGTTWRPLVEALAVLGLSDSAVRRRVRRGEMASRHGARGELLVAVPITAEASTPSSGGSPAGSSRDSETLRALLNVREEQVRTLEAELASRRAQAEADATERAELRRLLLQAQSLIPRLHAPRLYADPPGGEEGAAPGTRPPSRQPWWRFRRGG
ncbi:MAG TPA: hypothetical protein VNG93_05035 [Candidatus Dormibacteraeota bacterium]|nr:hypothetical protein [Candidatus Dormibacteraeota bacterium]